jgi:hypothetical protein
MKTNSRRIAGARPITIYAVVVIANYVAQVPYTWHLYGASFSRAGVLLLGATLAWFLTALVLFRAARRAGYWLLLGYAVVQVPFYLNSEVLQALVGYGLPYHLSRTEDPIVWLAFLAGDVNFVAAVGAVVFLLRHRPGARSASSE